MKDLVLDLIENEKKRQSEGLELIPSENYVSRPVLEAMGSVLTNKYSEGYPYFDGINEWDEAKIAKSTIFGIIAIVAHTKIVSLWNDIFTCIAGY